MNGLDEGQDARTLALALKCRWEELRRAARNVVAKALESSDGNLLRAGELMGIGRKALGRMVEGDDRLNEIRLELASKWTGVGRRPEGLEKLKRAKRRSKK